MTEPLDIEAARERASRLSQLANERLQRVAIAELTIEALLDIAQSLRFVAAEAALAMGETEPEPESVEGDAPEWMLLDVGDPVAHVATGAYLGTIRELAVREGEPAAFVHNDESSGWAFLRNLVAASAPEPEDVEELEGEIAAPEDLVDDIDNDFDGDPHAAAEDAVERLREAEAARKAVKKGKKK